MQRFATLALTLIAAASIGARADAAVKKLQLHVVNITETPLTSPKLLLTGPSVPPEPPLDTAFVDDSAPGSPMLQKFRFRGDGTNTVLVPGIAGAGARIFLSGQSVEGTGPFRKPASFTGSGHTAAGSTIRWGVVTGWTITGQQYCNSDPPVICTLALYQHDTTVDPAFHSDFYDLGTWAFHSTGFTGTPFVHQYFTNSGNFSNNQRWVRGFFLKDATVPALPLVGMSLLAASLVVGAAVAFARRRDP